jgi:hypothetical protein
MASISTKMLLFIYHARTVDQAAVTPRMNAPRENTPAPRAARPPGIAVTSKGGIAGRQSRHQRGISLTRDRGIELRPAHLAEARSSPRGT